MRAMGTLRMRATRDQAVWKRDAGRPERNAAATPIPHDCTRQCSPDGLVVHRKSPQRHTAHTDRLVTDTQLTNS